MVAIYTDGSVYPNPNGDGGWSFVKIDDDGVITVTYGHALNTTNNRMELTAILQALKNETVVSTACIFSDSEYSINSITKWMWKWIKEKQYNRANYDLFKDISKECHIKPYIKYEWTKGHDGQEFNELADLWAGKARKEKIEGSFVFYNPNWND